MATSPSHKFGQIIGDMLESTLRDPLQNVAREHGLYLDYQHPRRARGGARKVTWKDSRGNTHDLDYVLEAGGTEDRVGTPKAFIEIAWRRYTKHSRNKAQEIQGAVSALSETYSVHRPFLGAVLGGVFTDGSLTQLKSLGFHILFFPYDSIVAVFGAVGVDASFDEDTPDRELAAKVASFGRLAPAERHQVATRLRERHSADIQEFIGSLKTSLSRTVTRVLILPLHGAVHELVSADKAVAFINAYDERATTTDSLRKYEITVFYSNGDEIRGMFKTKPDAIAFLRSC